MSSTRSTPRRTRRAVLSGALAIGLLLTSVNGVEVVRADSVGDAQRRVDQMMTDLENLRDQMGQIDEDYNDALDRKAQLDQEIATSQVKIDEMAGQVGQLEQLLTQIAVDRFTSGETLQLSPVFADASTYTAAEQRSSLSGVAIDNGQTDIDGLQKIADALTDERNYMARKQGEATDLITTLTDKQAEYDQLEQVYLTKYAQAEKSLGQAKLQAAEEKRAAAAAARAAAAAASKPSSSTPRGGGGSGGSSGSSGAVTYPAPSGRAGIAVSAAMSQLGVPYRFAAAEPGVAFDCSGLTAWAWGQAGVSLPHQSRRQYGVVAHVPKDQARPGDLIFYYSPIGHVGLYLGNGQMVHAPQAGSTVSVTTVHWNKVVGVGRPG